MTKFVRFLFSMPMTGILLLLFALAIGGATFIENDYGTQTAWAEVYGARWFELLMVWMGINLMISIVKGRMWQKESLPAFLFHSAFLLILVGAGITRYTGYEGSLHIRAGESENRMLTSEGYFQLQTTKTSYDEVMLLSSLRPMKWEKALHIDDKDVAISLVRYLPAAQKGLKADPQGKAALHMMVSEGDAPNDVIMMQGESYDTGSTILAFDTNITSNVKTVITLTATPDGSIMMRSANPMSFLSMETQKGGSIEANQDAQLSGGRLYTSGSLNFVVKEMLPHAKSDIVAIEKGDKKMRGNAQGALEFALKVGNETKNVIVMGTKGEIGDPVNVTIAGVSMNLSYGSKIVPLPFALRLDKFTMERYAGSMSPSSYQSDVMVMEGNKTLFPYQIYMNHVLDHGGYRFFQSSYDADELGTILSVSHDPGKIPTYIGYLLMGLGLFWSLFNPQSRFRSLARSLRQTSAALIVMVAIVLGSAPQAHAAASQTEALKAIETLKNYDTASAEQFGEFLVQDTQGRIKPLNTLAIEILNKVAKTSSIMGLTPDQALMGMVTRPRVWQDVTMIKVSHPLIIKELGLPDGTTKVAFNDFFDYTKEEPYKLKDFVEEANRKRPALRDKFDNEVIKVDERVNICYMVYTGEVFRLFPRPGDKTQTWYSPTDAIAKFPPKESQVIRLILSNYFMAVDKALETNKWDEVKKGGELLSQYQHTYGETVIPPATKLDAELFYNKANIFSNLVYLYFIAGFLLLGFGFAAILKPSVSLRWPTRLTWGLLVIGFVIHTLGLALRWYISGHAPWSDGYESMIYIAWATILAGFYFSRYSPIAMASTGVLGGLTLFVAHMGWMDPQVTNLVPVLKSYWLNIHVSMITGSYGFLALGALLAFLVLILFVLRSPSRPHLDKAIGDLLKIDEMTLLIGLSMLTLGNFLGGVWANESWGRYWGWDPKETWALASIVIYAFVTHMRFIPGLKSPFAFAVASLLAFSSIIMTYFGVNYYLSGLHSYAAGDPVPVPTFVYYTIATIAMVIILAFPKRHLSSSKGA